MEERMEEIEEIIESWRNCEKDSEDACMEISQIFRSQEDM